MDRVNNIEAVADSMPAGLSVSYTLDDWYRTAQTQFTGGEEETLSFTFDTIDRIMSASSSDSASVANRGDYAYSSTQPLAVTSAGDLALTYDPAGHLLTRGELTFSRDELGRLNGVDRGGAPAGKMLYSDLDRVVQITNDGTLVLYSFNTNFEVRDGVSRLFVRIADARVARQESTALAASIYPDAVADGEINAGDAYVALIQGDEGFSTEHVLAAAAARVLSESEDAKAFLHLDHLGSILVATDEGGEVRGQRGFYPFGALRFSTGHVDPYGFTGQEMDVASSLVHMTFRELDPLTGRWDRFDPLFINPSADVLDNVGNATTGYAYVANNSSTLNDPSGLKPPQNKPKKSTRRSRAYKKIKSIGKKRSKILSPRFNMNAGSMTKLINASTGSHEPMVKTGNNLILLQLSTTGLPQAMDLSSESRIIGDSLNPLKHMTSLSIGDLPIGDVGVIDLSKVFYN